MRHRAAALSLIAVLASIAPRAIHAQTASALSAAKMIWTSTIGYVTAAAEQVPESSYSFRPVAAVRTFGQIVAHVAGSQHMFCAAAMGEKPTAEDDVEKTATTKTAIVNALKASTVYCQKAYAMSDGEALGRSFKMFGMDTNGMWALILNAAHDDEHYGNLVTYMRTLGMVPPSSQPQPGR